MPDADSERRYNDLRDKLDIDLLRLDDSLIEMPLLVMEVGEEVALALGDRDRAKNAYDLACVSAANDLRKTPNVDSQGNEKQRSEKQIESEIGGQPAVIRAQAAYEDAKFEAARWQTLSEAVRTKGHSLSRICELIVAGYLTPNAVRETKRSENVKRRALQRRV
jgi:hypothetical protein